MAATLINLRPWREDRRKDRQQRFVVSTFFTTIMAIVLVWAVGFYIQTQTTKQQNRNSFLTQEMAKLDSKIEEIRTLRAQRERLLERLQAIQDLQGNRPVIVRTFDELVRVLPDELYYTALTRQGESLHVTGRAQNNKDVSALMRNLDRSEWFKNPNLSTVGKGDTYKNFDMNVGLTKPQRKQEG
ncbi:PilN domain-containing protein [Motiliproteus sp. SC1-56]|uniref:PilN domain-containing protein n=1 Tax=Motiliproteus sp. SC1-56 TaxID=2799565 RepID=UPI001A90B4E7|nr:PilN domain-containing protein [Motiliproteus sp. SC1-56]